MSVKQLLDRLETPRREPGNTEEWRPEWKVDAVFVFGAKGPETFPVEIFEARGPELEGRVFCVVKKSNHFPPRFETKAGAYRGDAISCSMGTQINYDTGSVEVFGEYTPLKAAELLQIAMVYIMDTLSEFVSDNHGKIQRKIQRRKDQEYGPGGAFYGKASGDRRRGA